MRGGAAAACLFGILALLHPAAAQERVAIRSGGLLRDALVQAAPAAAPRPLLILLHGRFGTGQQILREAATGLGAGFVVVAPDGYRRSWASGRGMTPADRDGVDDVAFLRALVGAVAARHPIDPSRVYVAGMSNGGFMAARLACDAPDLVAGIAIVGATTGEGLASGCRPGRPIAVLLIHGTRDPLIGADGTAARAVGRIMGAAEAARFWAMQEGCTAASSPRPLPHPGPPDGTVAWRTDFAPCRGGVRVAFIEIRGGGHVWPGRVSVLPERLVGPPTRAVDATAAILDFFQLGPR